MTLTAARQVADAILYEGYLLYPYRASSSKNQVRWQFGILGSSGAAEAGVGEPTSMSVEVVLGRASGASVDIVLRFLQVQSRVVERQTDTGWECVDELRVAGTRWIPFHEAVAREVCLAGLSSAAEQSVPVEMAVGVEGGQDIEELREGGVVVGRLIRTRWPLEGRVIVTSRPGNDSRLTVLGVRVENLAEWSLATWSPEDVRRCSSRDLAARSSFVGTHLLMTAAGTRFVPLLTGPPWAGVDTAGCAQERCWPVLIADDAGKDAVLVSPIILGDHPTIAPESVGDLFDATEIDEILTLRVLTMTEQEREEARGTDPRAAQILARCEAMTEAELGELHGGRRRVEPPDLEDVPVYGEDIPWWDEGQEARAEPERDSVLVDGIAVAKGSRVLLRPSRRADAQDIFLAGQTAVVTRVYFDVDGGTHVAVALEDDPGVDLYAATGRYYYFGPEEIEPLPQRVLP